MRGKIPERPSLLKGHGWLHRKYWPEFECECEVRPIEFLASNARGTQPRAHSTIGESDASHGDRQGDEEVRDGLDAEREALMKLGRTGEARVEFDRAASLAQNTRERELLLDRARGGCRGSGRAPPDRD